jgi:hypothetical protein
MSFPFDPHPLGLLPGLDDWEVVIADVRLRAPAAEPPPLMSAKKAQPNPGPTISIRRGRGAGTAEQALAEFLSAFGKQASGLETLERGTTVFDDGASGVHALIAFDGDAGRVAQLHVYRADGGLVTHLTATIQQREANRIEAELHPMLRRFTVQAGG